MAEKEPVIVIKKINVVAGGHHGGSWKVAFADFMTAMMAFFLVMWLISQSQEVKENVADYFSTPSVIEYNFSNYGVELTLEKLFLDLVNEPLKVFEAFVTPIDRTPNVLAMGSKNMIMQTLANELGDSAENVEISRDGFDFEIPAERLFVPGTANPSKEFVTLMEKLKGITTGLEDANIFIDAKVYYQSVPDRSETTANKVAEQRLDIVSKKIEVGLEHQTVEVFGKTVVTRFDEAVAPEVLKEGVVKIRIRQKETDSKGRKPREIEGGFGQKDDTMDVYNNFVKQLSDKPKKKSKN